MQVVSGTAFPQNGSISSSNGKSSKADLDPHNGDFRQVLEALTVADDDGNPRQGNVVNDAHPDTDAPGEDETVSAKKSGTVADDEPSEEEATPSGVFVTGWIGETLPSAQGERPNLEEWSSEELAALRKGSASEKQQSLLTTRIDWTGVKLGDESFPVRRPVIAKNNPPAPETNFEERIAGESIRTRTASITTSELLPQSPEDIALPEPEESDSLYGLTQRPKVTVKQSRGQAQDFHGLAEADIVSEEEEGPFQPRVQSTDRSPALRTAEGLEELPLENEARNQVDREAQSAQIDPSSQRGEPSRPATGEEVIRPGNRSAAKDGSALVEEGKPSLSGGDEEPRADSPSARESMGPREAQARPHSGRARTPTGTTATTPEAEEETGASSRTIRGVTRRGDSSLSGFDMDSFDEPDESTSETKFNQEPRGSANAAAKQSVASPTAPPSSDRPQTLVAAEGTDFTSRLAERLEEMVDTIVRERGPGGSEQVSITLHPEHLGRLLLRVRVDEAGIVHARFVADNAAVRTMIEQDLGQLRVALSEHGLSLGEAGVEAEVGSHGQDPSGMFAQTDANSSFAHSSPAEDDASSSISGVGVRSGESPEDGNTGDPTRTAAAGIDIRV